MFVHPHWNTLFPRVFVALLIATYFVAGCGDDNDNQGPIIDDYDPIELTNQNRGVPLGFGDLALAEQIGPSRLAEISDNFKVGVLTFQLFDQLAYRLDTQPLNEARKDAKIEERVENLMDELGSNPLVDEYMFVIDLFLLDQSYLVVWDGKTQRGPEDFGFWRMDYRQSIIEQLTGIAATYTPSRMVIGADINRFWSIDAGDYGNFVTLYRELYFAIKDVSPHTRVAPGIDWPYLVYNQAPTFAGTEEEKIENAYGLLVEPLMGFSDGDVYIGTADFLGLSAVPDPSLFQDNVSNIPETFFHYLRGLPDELAIIYYKINWPITSEVYRNKQNEWLEKVLEYNGGVNVELMSWASLADLSDGTCNSMTLGVDARPTGAPRFVCFAGLWSVSGAQKDVYQQFIGQD